LDGSTIQLPEGEEELILFLLCEALDFPAPRYLDVDRWHAEEKLFTDEVVNEWVDSAAALLKKMIQKQGIEDQVIDMLNGIKERFGGYDPLQAV
jgi:hypothetical protein